MLHVLGPQASLPTTVGASATAGAPTPTASGVPSGGLRDAASVRRRMPPAAA
jgi:hypothetical protein